MGAECLLAFDLAKEKFRLFKTPVRQEIELVTRLEVLKGCLVDERIWGSEFLENDKKVLLEMHQYNHTKLVWYEIEKKRGERVKIQNLPVSFRTAICCGSLLLLDGDNLIDLAKQKKNKRKR